MSTLERFLFVKCINDRLAPHSNRNSTDEKNKHTLKGKNWLNGIMHAWSSKIYLCQQTKYVEKKPINCYKLRHYYRIFPSMKMFILFWMKLLCGDEFNALSHAWLEWNTKKKSEKGKSFEKRKSFERWKSIHKRYNPKPIEMKAKSEKIKKKVNFN